MRRLVLFAFLVVFWLALTGHYTAFLIGCGIAVSAAAAAATTRLRTDDDEALPLAFMARIPLYYPWLLLEIAKSSWSVARVILHPALPVSPVMTTVRAGQKTATGVATYANSITLTPGTVTTGVRGKRLTVYALTRAGADEVEAGGMDAKVARFEGLS